MALTGITVAGWNFGGLCQPTAARMLRKHQPAKLRLTEAYVWVKRKWLHPHTDTALRTEPGAHAPHTAGARARVVVENTNIDSPETHLPEAALWTSFPPQA